MSIIDQNRKRLSTLLWRLKDTPPQQIAKELPEIKKEMRELLLTFRNGSLLPPSLPKPIVFYSFLSNPSNPKVNEHEFKRLDISIGSIRKHNPNIEIRFCLDKPEMCPDHFISDYNVVVEPFHSDFDSTLPNAWCIHRWYNLKRWEKERLRILYLDADTYINDDIAKLFEIYCIKPVYGREELGFRHDPNTGIAGEDPRFFLDIVDAGIFANGGRTQVQTYCLGVILLNASLHSRIIESLDYYSQLLKDLKSFKAFYSIPNYRIADEYAFWCMLSRLGVECGLFGDQDVSHTFLEKKHETSFNPVVLHYTTKDEEKFADWAPEFFKLSRTEDEREASDPSTVTQREGFADSAMSSGIDQDERLRDNVNPMMPEEIAMSLY